MAVTLPKVLVAAAALWCFTIEGNPVNVMHGDICKMMNGRKYYLESDTLAIISATNVTLPTFPRIATQISSKSSGPYHRTSRRHRREGAQEIGLISEPRFRRNITSITLSSLAASNLVAPKTSFMPAPDSTRLLTPLRTPALEEHAPPPSAHANPLSEGELSTSSPILLEETKDDLESESDVTTSLSQPLKCGVEILTRPDCHLELTFKKVNLPSCSHDKSCRCDYLRLREPPYRGTGGLDICSMGDETPDTFLSQTKEVRMDFIYTRTYEDAFAISITAKRNKYRIFGKVNSTLGSIRSPFFPELYPKEHWMEYDLVAKEENARIKVTFLDFQLSPWSFVEVQDTNKTRLAVFNGNIFRPPVLISSGPHITIRFSGNGETARGFNLEYAFVDAMSTAMTPPITNCGGYVTNFGGTITMMNMSKDVTNYTMYDCVWIVQPPQNYAYKSHLSIKVVQFEEMASATTLEIRQGVTSDDYLLEKIESGDPKQTQEHVVAVDTGFYVRLRGFFNKDSKLAIVYSSFSYLGSCYSLTDLMCHNHRCIPKMLRCDGFDHCGDNSDEPSTCYVGAGSKGLTPEDAAWWYQHTPNYYFPQKNSFLGGQHGWSGVLLLTSLILMVLLMIGLISYMFKQTSSTATRRDRRHGGHSHRGSLIDDVEVVDASADDPPLYEPPPDYEEVIKVILSGNNLKLVRRPGGLTAWVPDKLVEEGSDGDNQPKNDRPTRTRHASLDLEQGMEVVLWNSNTAGTPRSTNNATTTSSENEYSTTLSPVVPFRMGHVRRSSLPTAPTPETMHNGIQGHSVSIAPETIPEGPESLESPRPSIHRMHTISSPHISLRSFNYDTSAVSTPGPSTPQLLRSSPKIRKSKKVSKKGGKRKKSSAAKKPEQQEIKDDSAPPSYEDAMQQVRSTTPLIEAQSNSDASSQVNESTQTSIDQSTGLEEEELSPSDRVQAAREMFQKLSNVDKKPVHVTPEAHGSQHIAKRPAVQATRTKHHKSAANGGTISRGTVKARKAMLLKSQKLRRDCDCNGACSCAHFKPESPTEDTSSKGGVKSKVQYYLNIEESTKKREYDSSVEQSSTEQESQPSQKLPAISDATSAALKKRRLVRNQSAPTIGRIRDLDLEIYFSQNEGMDVAIPSPSEDLERPLITPVTESPRPVFIVPKNSSGKNEVPKQAASPSIQHRVKLYNELTKPESPLPLSPHTPSPRHSPIQGIKVGHILRADSGESLDEENDSGIISMRAIKNAACDTSIKPGLVKAATAKFITTLAADMRPKLCPQDSDDWNTSCDSPLPVRIPYLNLKNEASSSPDISENEKLILPPLRREEAESIELWNSISQGLAEQDEDFIEVATETISPSSSSGAVPKKSASEVTIKLNKKCPIKSKNKEGPSQEIKSCLENDREVKTSLNLNLKDKFSPASEMEEVDSENSKHLQNSSPLSSRLVLEEVNLGQAVVAYQSSSDDESLPPSPRHRQNLNETLILTLDSEIDLEVASKSVKNHQPATVSPGSCITQPKQVQEMNTKKKFPVPSPRGSKALQPKLPLNPPLSPVQSESSLENQSKGETTSRVSSPMYESTSPSPVSSPVSASTSPSPNRPGMTSPTIGPSALSTPRTLMTPTLSPQMERSGIVTINTSKRLKWDYI